MADSMYTALSGAMAQEQALEIVAHNLANVSTHGFKGDTLDFAAVLAQSAANPAAGGVAPTSVHVQVAQTQHDFSQGLLKQTGGNLDVALVGAGFFVVDTPNGEKLTRQGAFTLRGDGYLQNVDGYLVQGSGGAIHCPVGAKIRLDSYGALYATPPPQGLEGTEAFSETLLDRLRIVDVLEPQKLQREGHALWDAQNTTMVAMDTPVEVGALEQSNVNPIKMMTQLIAVQRSYETYTKSIETVRTMEQKATSQLG